MSKYNTHISPREFNNVNDFREMLMYNYAVKIHNYSGAKRDARQLMKQLTETFGADWHLVPFKKLVAAAKIGNAGAYAGVEFKRETPGRFIAAPVRVSITQDLVDSTYARAILKYYNKKVLQDIMESKVYSTRESELSYLIGRFTDAIGVAMFVKKYDKKELKKLKNASGLASIGYCNHIVMSAKDMRVNRDVLPEYVAKELLEDSAKSIVTIITKSDRDPDSISEILSNIRDKIYSDAYRVKNYGARYRRYHVKHLCNDIREYTVAKDYAKMLDDLQMDAANYSCGWFKKINRKAYNAAKQVTKSNVSLAAKQKTLRDMTDYIYRYARYSRVVWIPKLTIRETEGEK